MVIVSLASLACTIRSVRVTNSEQMICLRSSLERPHECNVTPLTLILSVYRNLQTVFDTTAARQRYTNSCVTSWLHHWSKALPHAWHSWCMQNVTRTCTMNSRTHIQRDARKCAVLQTSCSPQIAGGMNRVYDDIVECV